MFHDGSVDFDKLKSLVEWHIQQGSDALIACGTTGEASTLNDEEHIAVIEAVVKQAAGPHSCDRWHWFKQYATWDPSFPEAERVGADALLVMAPLITTKQQKRVWLLITRQFVKALNCLSSYIRSHQEQE